MDTSIFHRLSNILWGCIVLAVVVLALYVSVGRYLMSNVAFWKDDILRELNARLPFVLEASDVQGEWRSFTPELIFSDLRLLGDNVDALPLELEGGRVVVDIWQSLRRRSLQIAEVSLRGFTLRAELTAEGKLQVPGLPSGGGALGGWLTSFLLNTEHLQLSENNLSLQLPGGSLRQLELGLELRRDGRQWWLEGLVTVMDTDSDIIVLGSGIGNPAIPDSFSGDLHLDIAATDLTALLQMFPAPLAQNVTSAAGEANLQAWFSWRRGVTAITLDVAGSELQVSSGEPAQRLPLDSVSFQAALQQKSNGWDVTLADLRLADGAAELEIPRLQFSTRGNRLALWLEGLPLAQLNDYAVGLARVPAGLREVLATLDLRGEVPLLHALIEDYTAPADDWLVVANFDSVNLEPWRGAPGASRARGYLAFDQDGGKVQLDGQQFALNLPKIYHEPLRYDELYGTVYVNWYEDAMILSSELITARGVEGEATVLFGLSIPFDKQSPVGLEMDLLVGLQNSNPVHRRKYLPYILSDPLLDWLRASIGEGRIEEGAFLWRGSLRKGAADLRTIQLFFNVADTRLEFHPDWPALDRVDGVVLIDDVAVSVWAESAQIYDSIARDISAEAWQDEQSRMLLAVRGSLEGSAGDGLRLVNNSPLGGLVGGAFSQWQAQGQLSTELALRLDLGDVAANPGVQVQTRWEAVDLSIVPGGLPLSDVSGQLDYSSAAGFSSQALQGRLWGEPITALVRQLPVAEDAEAPPARAAPLGIDVSGRVDMAGVRNWLGLAPLALASGSADASARITVNPGSAPLLELSSDLLGVGLDLPAPWHKPAEQAADLSLRLPLGGDERTLRLGLDSALYLDIALADAGVAGIALGLGEPPDNLVPGEIRLAGATPLLDGEEWQGFVETYLTAEEQDSVADSASAGLQLPLRVPGLEIAQLRLAGQEIKDVFVQLEQGHAGWRIAARTSWLRGEVLAQSDFSLLQVDIEELDLDGLGQLEFGGLEGVNPATLELPDLNVNLQQVSHGGQPLGKLRFDVRSQPGGISFDDISGDVAGLVLDSEAPGRLTWLEDGQGSRSSFTGDLQFLDLGQVLERFDYQRFLRTSNGRVSLQLDWPGGPQQVGLIDARGALQLEVQEGQFLQASAATSGSLRVVSILNLADFIDRFSLNMSHMFKSGIPFYSIAGDVVLADNTLQVNTLQVEGRSSQFGFTGSAGVLSRTMDGELAITLPVANNLPWVAALVGGIPMAAGVFVVSRLFGEQVNRLASAVYEIEGPWDEPEVQFDRIFDNETRKEIRPEDIEAAVEEVKAAPAQYAPAEETAAEETAAEETAAEETAAEEK